MRYLRRRRLDLTFTERELGPLLDRADDLLEVLRAYLASGRNKSAAAASMHLSRPAFYERLRERNRGGSTSWKPTRFTSRPTSGRVASSFSACSW